MTPKDLKEWLEPRLEKIADDMADMKVVQAGQAKDISHHIRRSDAIEARVEQVAASVKPVAEHVQRLRGMWATVVGTGVVVGIVAGLWKVFS